VRLFVAGALIAALAIVLRFATVQKDFANSTFDFGKVRQFHGAVLQDPYPTLVAPGKHGAGPLVRSYAGQLVHLKGTLITRREGQMIEVVPSTAKSDGAANRMQNEVTELGDHVLTDEIVDTKCFLGVMNPGSGKVHRKCGALCLAGGIPPGLFTQDFEGGAKLL
jgi:hypothetical protein